MSLQLDANVAVGRNHREVNALSIVADLKSCSVVFTGKETPACDSVKDRIRIASRDKDTLRVPARLVPPTHGYPVRRVFAGDAYGPIHPQGSDLFEPDQTNSSDSEARQKFRSERTRELSRHDVGGDPKVNQESSSNETLNDGKSFHRWCAMTLRRSPSQSSEFAAWPIQQTRHSSLSRRSRNAR
jgi:hypothetical protein